MLLNGLDNRKGFQRKLDDLNIASSKEEKFPEGARFMETMYELAEYVLSGSLPKVSQWAGDEGSGFPALCFNTLVRVEMTACLSNVASARAAICMKLHFC